MDCVHYFHIRAFDDYSSLLDIFCGGTHKRITDNPLGLSTFGMILHELERMVIQGTKVKKNYNRAKLFARILKQDLKLEFIDNDDDNKLLINQVLNIEEDIIVSSLFKSTLVSSSSNNAMYEYQYALKAAATSRIHILTDELWMCFTYVLDEITTTIANDQFLAHFYNNKDIFVMFKGSRPAGFLLREHIGNNIEHPDYYEAQTYGRTGDNDAGILINPSLPPKLFNDIRYKIISIARNIMIESRSKFEPVILRLVGPSLTLDPKDVSVLMEPVKLDLAYDSYPTKTKVYQSCSVVDKIRDVKPSFIYYSESDLAIEHDRIYKFKLMRLMILYKSSTPLCRLRPDLEFDVKVELGDLSVSKQTSGDAELYFEYKDKLDFSRVAII